MRLTILPTKVRAGRSPKNGVIGLLPRNVGAAIELITNTGTSRSFAAR